ncbi:NAD-dependent succinate-semialdehyde dehydrogenase [Gilvimarinus sp. 1_MG-2023]|uniref:NAD-dependent succinate-semialdehyde dehydrogenase n=1 Tax=Gilvimarinus sp. 1_MG-2023 TaxID=3062638 RepID=UPI0026E27290|nr:NAD-dependent succinate-semialdehyde dehydrogenase [Gilvimarinus sp. 1_MG-2023]MDO6745734.1 NAD-dependent succinate-semialdehyde dehydrogenase [Gilvimarinus sp. 1_MG-2023]
MTAIPQLTHTNLWQNRCYIGGQWVAAVGDNTLEVVNPANGEALAQVPLLTQKQANAALVAAEQAFDDWRARSPNERGALLRRWYELMLKHKDDLATIMTLEQGKPWAESNAEIQYAAAFIDWFAEEAKRGFGDVIPATKPHQQLLAIPEPVGVSVAITPWNFPAAMITRKAGAALAAGCSMVVKPSALTPLSALALAVLAQEAGIPDGVFNVITGKSADIGEVFTQSTIVKKLSFTGSTEVGRHLMAQCAPNLQKLSLELGGNAPFIVFADADLDLAVQGVIAAKFRNSGQTCISPNRFLVEVSVQAEFVQRLTKALADLKVGDGLEEGVQVCSLINDKALDKVRRHYDDALAQGARCEMGQRPGSLANNRIAPIVLTQANEHMQFWQEETFGPLVAIKAFNTEEQALALANDTHYGLASYFYTASASRVVRVSRALQAGMVGVNEGAISNAMAPFGGIDQSGFGREGGRQGMREYQSLKYICQSIDNG